MDTCYLIYSPRTVCPNRVNIFHFRSLLTFNEECCGGNSPLNPRMVIDCILSLIKCFFLSGQGSLWVFTNLGLEVNANI